MVSERAMKVHHLRHTKRRAEKLGVPFDLSPDDLEFPTVCPMLGIPLVRGGGYGGTENSPTIDRVVGHLGYVKGNVQVISAKANRMKQNASGEELMKVAQFVMRLEAEHNQIAERA